MQVEFGPLQRGAGLEALGDADVVCDEGDPVIRVGQDGCEREAVYGGVKDGAAEFIAVR